MKELVFFFFSQMEINSNIYMCVNINIYTCNAYINTSPRTRSYFYICINCHRYIIPTIFWMQYQNCVLCNVWIEAAAGWCCCLNWSINAAEYAWLAALFHSGQMFKTEPIALPQTNKMCMNEYSKNWLAREEQNVLEPWAGISFLCNEPKINS